MLKKAFIFFRITGNLTNKYKKNQMPQSEDGDNGNRKDRLYLS